MIDIDKLLVDYEGDSVCGNNYEYNALMIEMRTAIQGKPEQRLGDGVIDAEEPDWKLVKKNCLALCKKTHHLEVSISLTRALMNLRGFAGLAAGSEFLAEMIERYWDCLYPQIDPSDNDPMERLNQLTVFDDFTFLLSVRKVELLKSPMGVVSLYAVEKSKEYKEGEENSIPDPKIIAAVFREVKENSQDTIEEILTSLDSCINNFKKISSFLQKDSYVGVNQAPSFHELLKLLTNAKNLMAEHFDNALPASAQEDGIMDNTSKQSNHNGHVSVPVSSSIATQQTVQGIHSREAAIAALEEVEDYFIKNEPSSPIPFMLQRAKGMVDKDFISLMEDLAPDGINQAETVFGTYKP